MRALGDPNISPGRQMIMRSVETVAREVIDLVVTSPNFHPDETEVRARTNEVRVDLRDKQDDDSTGTPMREKALRTLCQPKDFQSFHSITFPPSLTHIMLLKRSMLESRRMRKADSINISTATRALSSNVVSASTSMS